MTLKAVVESNSQLAPCWKSGIQALRKKDKERISAKGHICTGSIDIDTCLKKHCPHDNRWDYGLEVGDKGVFIEMHSAYTTEIKTIMAKLEWLKTWFISHCIGFKELGKSFYWIASGPVAISKGSPQAKRLAQSGITGPIKYLKLDG